MAGTYRTPRNGGGPLVLVQSQVEADVREKIKDAAGRSQMSVSGYLARLLAEQELPVYGAEGDQPLQGVLMAV